ncbi:glycine dehydrogenase (decarboxylating) alpha subunit [Roseiarcus fermentans]|uniref:Probable glycine dehydrogenase (decarboxylating) subunit 1 n=1 Tax=Roseiarcus fermentans TaxID=1473586 RepID=A0A366EFA0_9HYPH|nr:aminomethyl-transferring glycine dehydrogenase subunit GcvPA [Roseiarcus fermentans]RBP01087.1 glycine dehydrogenase (decarboxylating) alpha subunit [Roseiarcus fermentans]
MRYLPLDGAEREAMLARIGVPDVDALFADVPADKRIEGLLDLPLAKSEMAVERILSAMAAQSLAAGSAPFFLGAGAYKRHIPASVDHLIQRSEFLTSYTPYQPEIAQGTLKVLFEFQTQVATLTGMEVANASMYDGSTACGEAMLMAHRLTRRGKAVLSGGLHPQYADVAATLAHCSGDRIERLAPDPLAREDLAAAIDGETSCVIVQSPDFFGNPRDLAAVAAAAHARGALLIAVFTDPVSLGALRSPGAMDADIVVGEGQGIGNALSFGGPYLGLFATRLKFVRQMPGRLAGETVDADGRRSFVLTLSTREQHIRREKATSNICTNSGLCALAFSIHLALLGGVGLRRLARVNHAGAVQLAERLSAVPGVEILNAHFFNEFTLRTPRPGAEVIEALARRGVIGGLPVSRLLPAAGLDDCIVVASTEVNSDDDRAAYASALADLLR